MKRIDLVDGINTTSLVDGGGSGDLSTVFRYQGKEFGRHVRSCRRARGLTQEALAARSELSVDTIRRLEHGSFSPSLETLSKLTQAFGVSLSTLFEAFEFGARNLRRELVDLVTMMSAQEQLLLIRLIPLLCELGGATNGKPADDGGTCGA